LQKRAAKFANINELGWETLAQHKLIAQICALFKAYTGGWAWKGQGIDFYKLATWVGMIIIRKLWLGQKEQMLVNIPS